MSDYLNRTTETTNPSTTEPLKLNVILDEWVRNQAAKSAAFSADTRDLILAMMNNGVTR
jgi:hypothetical protein